MNDVCSIELLRNAVARGLSADEETALHAHLEHCEACCAQMEQLAGGEAWQQEAAALLSADELDAAVPEPANWSEVDFSVEHLDPSDDPNVLGQLGGYDVLAIVGRGGMGVVLKAFDRELKRLVAIKALAPHLAHSSVARKRFVREAQAAAAVVNPHVIAIHQVQPTGRLPFLIMPLLTGESLAQRLKARGPLELTEVLRIGMQAAAGLAAAHDQGLVHRDVKPANIFLEKGVERVVITDFGLARAADDVSMTRQGVVAGTPEYMSPEQARGEALDGRSDLFSLGCVLYEMATGVSPFRTDSTMATLRRIVDEQPAAMASLVPELPPWFCHIVERLLSKDPAQRFASASEVSQLLEQCLSHLQQPTSVPLPASLVPHATGRRSIFTLPRIGVIAMLGTIGMTLLGMVLSQATEAPDISGQWTSDEWGTVVLGAKQPGQYQGSYNGTNPAESGTMQLKWSRVERRFNGTWNAGDDRKGKISLRLIGDEIRGALRTAKNAEKESNSPRLGDFEWKRSRPAQEGRVTIQALPGSDVIVLKGTKVDLESLEAALSQQFSKKTTTSGIDGSSPRIIADVSLEGVWELDYPPDIAAKLPEDQRLRFVVVGDWQAHFRGDQRVTASRLKVEPQHTPKRLSYVGIEGKPMRGIYEVKENGLLLSVVPDTGALPTKFGTEFNKRVKGKVAEAQLAALKLYSKEATTTGEEEQNSPASTRTTPTDEDLAKHPPIEFRIAASKADRDADGVAWFPIEIIEPRKPLPAGESGANLPIEEKLDEKWRGLLWGKTEHTLLADGTWRVVKCEVAQSAQSTDLAPSFEIRITLDAVGGALLRRLTSTHLNRSLAIVVEGTIVAAPVLRSEFGEDFVITGNFSKTAADKLAAAIRKPDQRRVVSFVLRFAEVKSAFAAMKDEAASRKIRGFEATIDPRRNAVLITADADTLKVLQEILGRLDSEEKPHWRKFGVTPAPVSELTAKVLESIGLHFTPITQDRFRAKNVFAKYSGGLDVTFVRSDNGTAGKAGIHEADIVVKLQGRLMLNLADLDAAMQDAAEQIKRKDADSLQFDVLRSGETVRVNVPFPDLGVAMLRKDATEQIVTSFVLRFANSKSALATMKDEAASRKIHGFEATIDARRNSILIISDTVTLKALQEILERLDTKEGPDGDSNNTSPDRSTPQPSETRKTEKTEGIEDATPGIRVKLRLNGDRHSREMLQKNIGFDQLSLMGTGVKGTIDGKEVDNLVVVLAHGCRLESLEETENGGTKYWNATLFVQQGPTNDGSNLGLSQKRLDQMQEQGVQFWLDHHHDMSSRIAVSKTGTLADAVATFNAKAKLNQIGKDQPALTEDEVVAAIRGWIREMVPASDEVYDAFQKIAESRRLPERAELSFTTHAHGYRGFDSDVWWVDLVIFTGEETGYGFRIRDQKIRSRPSIEHEGVAKEAADEDRRRMEKARDEATLKAKGK